MPKIKAVVVAAALLLPSVGLPTLALTAPAQAVDQWAHITDCINWLINDQAKHAKFCIPSQVTQEQLDRLSGPNFLPPPATVVASSSSSSGSSSSVSSGSSV